MKRNLLLCLTICAALTGQARADILIGRLGSASNPIAGPTTIAAAQGFDLYMQKVNGSGGIHGQQVKVIARDDQVKPEMVVSQAHELIEKENVIALITPQGTPGTVSLLGDGILQKDSVAVVGPFTGASQVLGGDNVFPLTSSYEDEIAALARQMKNASQKRIAYMYYNTAQGPAFAPVFEKIVRDAGLDYAGSAGFDMVSDPAKQAELINQASARIAGFHADAVFAFVVGPTFPMAMKSLQATLGASVVRYTFSINSWESLVKQAGPAIAAGVVFSQAVPYPYGADRRIVIEYQHDLAKYSPDVKPNAAGLEGYMTAKVLSEALKRAGPNPSSKKLLTALEGLGRFDLGDYVVNYSTVQHRVEPSVDVTIINSSGNLIK
jgi:ABC-type branched-subunit amino acid transport system substrate-binding protein